MQSSKNHNVLCGTNQNLSSPTQVERNVLHQLKTVNLATWTARPSRNQSAFCKKISCATRERERKKKETFDLRPIPAVAPHEDPEQPDGAALAACPLKTR